MALIVTPGAPDADAMIDRAYFQAWATARGYDISGYNVDTAVDPAIRRGSGFMNVEFDWKGTKVNGRAQPMSWPRDMVYDETGEYVPNDEIPTEVEQATAYASYQELISPNSLQPTVVGGPQVKRTKVGPLEKEYFSRTADPASYKPTILAIGPLVDGLTEGGGAANSLAGISLRG